MKWPTNKNLLAEITCEQQDIVREFRPEWAAILDIRSPFYLVRSLMELIVNEIKNYSENSQKLEDKNKDLETALNNCHHVSWSLQIRIKEISRDVVARDVRIDALDGEIINLKDTNANLELQVKEAYREQEILRKNIVEMNHLIARQHQQLLGFLDTDFERP